MIGLYGGTCNNMYVMAKGLAQENIDVTFIRDRKDNFPHSQPVWEDVECFFQAGFDYMTIDWDLFEKEHSWIVPKWYYIPDLVENGEKLIYQKSRVLWPIKLFACKILRKNMESFSVFEKMRQCDLLIVCGVNAILLALLTGKPYIIFPHGSDIRLAIGAVSSGPGLKNKIFQYLISYAFKKAIVIGSTLPNASAAVPLHQYKRFKNLNIERIPLPYITYDRLDKLKRLENLTTLFKELNLELKHADFYAFTPSRLNFNLKGHDRLLEAINETNEKMGSIKIHFIFLGWGGDYQIAVNYVEENNLKEFVTILPVFCSKNFLYRFFDSVDFVIDSFAGSGGYGTCLSEAWSRGCPIVTWISDMFYEKGWEEPPVIQARSKEEIGEVIVKVSNGEIDLDEWSMKTAAWFNRVHSNAAVKQVVKEKFGHYLNAGRL